MGPQRRTTYFGETRGVALQAAFPELTNWEYAILTLIARLVLKPRTVRNRVSCRLRRVKCITNGRGRLLAEWMHRWMLAPVAALSCTPKIH